MEDKSKSEEQLIEEIELLRREVDGLKKEKIGRRGAEEALQESERRYRDLFENMMDGLVLHRLIVDEKGNPVDYVLEQINNAAEKILSWKRENIEGKRATEQQRYTVVTRHSSKGTLKLLKLAK